MQKEFADLYSEWGQRVYNVACCILRDRHAAEEANLGGFRAGVGGHTKRFAAGKTRGKLRIDGLWFKQREKQKRGE
jgi:hypothetical protein